MAKHTTFGDFILGLEGLAILRSLTVDPVTVKARAQKFVEISNQLEEKPWSNSMAAKERYVTAGYGEWADSYDNPGNPVFLAEEPVMRDLVARYPVGLALDAACGTGTHSACLASLGHQVIGIDATREMLELAKMKIPTAKFDTAHLTSLPLSEGAIDLAVCALALTHCADLVPPIKELARVVRNGGHIIISDVHPFGVTLGLQGGYRRNETEDGFVRNHVHLPSDYLNAFREAGLSVVQCKELLYGEREIATIEFANEMPDLMKAAVKGIPIVIIWELERKV